MSRLTINSNIPSLNAQRSLSNATKKLGDSYTRLSSGLRINKASDDAAGLSISESLKADTRLFNQGIRNLNDGVSLLNIADGALNELSNITIRLRELATQSANGTFSNKQRVALDQEAQSLSKEYNRIARTTEFNGRKIFNGDFGELSLSAGIGRSGLIVDGLGGGIGDGSFFASQSISAGLAPSQIKILDYNSDGISDFVTYEDFGNSFSLYIGNGNGTFQVRQSIADGSSQVGSPTNFFNNYIDLNNDGITDSYRMSGFTRVLVELGNANGTFQVSSSYIVGSQVLEARTGDFNGDGILDFVTPDRLVGRANILLGNGDGTFRAVQSYVTGGGARSVVVADFNGDGISDLATSDNTRVSILLGNGDGSFKTRTSFFSDTQNSIRAGDFNGDGFIDLVSTNPTSDSIGVLLGNGDGNFKASTSFVSGDNPVSIEIGDFNGDGVSDFVSTNSDSNTLSIFLGNANDGVSALQSFSLKTRQDSKLAMDYLSGALTRLSKQRGEIGAFQSRLDFATSTLQTSSLNYQEANSRITDIDVAEESSRLAATRILQQSAASILAQANQQPQLVLNLLRDL